MGRREDAARGSRAKEREERRAASGGAGGRKGRSMLGMTSAVASAMGDRERGGDAIPVITPNGTDVGTTAQIGHTPEKKSTSTASVAASAYTGGGATIADDASVLPVPSHVVLHHLSTSAIRNGVLAVGNTTRYKKKVGGVSGFSFCFVLGLSLRSFCLWRALWGD